MEYTPISYVLGIDLGVASIGWAIIEIDEDGFALSELLQWIWRSQIRQGKPIILYIPSKRMRELLEDFLDV